MRNEGGFNFSHKSGQRFPPIERLRLCRYHFGHSPSTVWDIWDFSRLESLTLWGDPRGLRPFLLAVLGNFLPRLKAFALSTFAQIDESSVGSWTSSIGLNFLLREFIAQLPPMKELCLDMQNATFLLPAIVRHGKTLRKLEFGGVIPGPKTKRSMTVKDLKTIQKLLPELVRLELDLDMPEEQVRPLLPPSPLPKLILKLREHQIANGHILPPPTLPPSAPTANEGLHASRPGIH